MTNEEIIEECVQNALQSIRYCLKHQDFSEATKGFESGWRVACDVITESLPEHVKTKTLEWIERQN